jgi:hypothetical protein
MYIVITTITRKTSPPKTTPTITPILDSATLTIAETKNILPHLKYSLCFQNISIP